MKLCISIICILFCFSCITEKIVDRTDIKEIKFGEGGGFTGAVTEYQIKSNGDVFISKTLEREYNKIKKISNSEFEKIKKNCSILFKETLNFNHPGNIYYFIEIDQVRIVWGNPSFTEPKELMELYNQLKETIN